jgi:hypothetical protein
MLEQDLYSTEGEPWRRGKAVALHEVMGWSPENSLLQKCRERLRT